MAYKAREIINAGRLQFDEEWDDVVHSFLMIRQHTTAKSNQITFISKRSKVGSHADLAWATMHVFTLGAPSIYCAMTPLRLNFFSFKFFRRDHFDRVWNTEQCHELRHFKLHGNGINRRAVRAPYSP